MAPTYGVYFIADTLVHVLDGATFKDFTDGAESIATTVAIAIGGIWTYMLFIQRRQKYPRAKISHRAAVRRMPGNLKLLRLTVHIENGGEVLLSVECVEVRIQRILPVAESVLTAGWYKETSELAWPMIKDGERRWPSPGCEIEPGEFEDVDFDFLIDNSVETVKTWSHVQNISKKGKDIGWGVTSLYDCGVQVPPPIVREGTPNV